MDRVFKALALVAGLRFVTPDQLQAVARRGTADPGERRRRVERRILAMFAAMALVAGRPFVTPDQLQAVSRRGMADPEERLLRIHRGSVSPLESDEQKWHSYPRPPFTPPHSLQIYIFISQT